MAEFRHRRHKYIVDEWITKMAIPISAVVSIFMVVQNRLDWSRILTLRFLVTVLFVFGVAIATAYLVGLRFWKKYYSDNYE